MSLISIKCFYLLLSFSIRHRSTLSRLDLKLLIDFELITMSGKLKYLNDFMKLYICYVQKCTQAPIKKMKINDISCYTNESMKSPWKSNENWFSLHENKWNANEML